MGYLRAGLAEGILHQGRVLRGELWFRSRLGLLPLLQAPDLVDARDLGEGLVALLLVVKADDVQRVFYLGDLDFSGEQIEENTRKVLTAYGDLEWERLAITQKQANDKNLTAISKPDRRFKPVQYFDAIETEALKQVDIQRLLRKRLHAELPEPLEDVLVREGEQREELRAKLNEEVVAEE